LKQRRLRQDLLPPHVLENADYWETQIVRHVHVDEVRPGTTHKPLGLFEDESFDVIEGS